MKRLSIVWALLAGCVEALPGDDRIDAGTGYLRLLRPRTGVTVSSRRPRLRWYRSDVRVDVRVELCADRGCARVLDRFDAVGGDAQAPRALPTGVVFWRVLPRSGDAVATWSSPTGWFVVARGARNDGSDASIDTRPHLQLDVDGDGRADVILPNGTIFRSLGSRFEAEPYGRLLDANGVGAVTAGDLNGDGYLDVAVAHPGGRPGGVVYLYLGPLPRGDIAPSRELTSADNLHTLSRQVAWTDAPAGDVDGDGYDDLLIASTRRLGSSGALLFRGGPSGVAYVAAQTIEPRLSNGSAMGVLAMTDLDGDGFDETLLTAAWGGYLRPGAEASTVFLHRGSPGGLETPAAWVLSEAVGDSAADEAGALGDLDGSGAATLVLRRRSGTTRCMRLVVDPLRGTQGEGGASLGCEEKRRNVGTSIEVGDVDGDGRADIVASVDSSEPLPAVNIAVRVYRAGAGMDWSATSVDRPPGATSGLQRFGLGDVDGDGVMDGIGWVETPVGRVAVVHRGGDGGLVAAGERIGP